MLFIYFKATVVNLVEDEVYPAQFIREAADVFNWFHILYLLLATREFIIWKGVWIKRNNDRTFRPSETSNILYLTTSVLECLSLWDSLQRLVQKSLFCTFGHMAYTTVRVMNRNGELSQDITGTSWFNPIPIINSLQFIHAKLNANAM